MERRQVPRFKVRFRTSFTAATMLGGEGMITDLSTRGCRITTDATVPQCTQLEMRLHIPGDPSPIEVETAEVAWCAEGEIGIEFKRLAPKTYDRLSRFLNAIKAPTLV